MLYHKHISQRGKFQRESYNYSLATPTMHPRSTVAQLHFFPFSGRATKGAQGQGPCIRIDPVWLYIMKIHYFFTNFLHYPWSSCRQNVLEKWWPRIGVSIKILNFITLALHKPRLLVQGRGQIYLDLIIIIHVRQ